MKLTRRGRYLVDLIADCLLTALVASGALLGLIVLYDNRPH